MGSRLRPDVFSHRKALVAADIGVQWNNLMASGVQVPNDSVASLRRCGSNT